MDNSDLLVFGVLKLYQILPFVHGMVGAGMSRFLLDKFIYARQQLRTGNVTTMMGGNSAKSPFPSWKQSACRIVEMRPCRGVIAPILHYSGNAETKDKVATTDWVEGRTGPVDAA